MLQSNWDKKQHGDERERVRMLRAYYLRKERAPRWYDARNLAGAALVGVLLLAIIETVFEWLR